VRGRPAGPGCGIDHWLYGERRADPGARGLPGSAPDLPRGATERSAGPRRLSSARPASQPPWVVRCQPSLDSVLARGAAQPRAWPA
jgi:hypothetical protein